MTLFRCVDFETTGMPGAEGSAVCEVGWCDIQIMGDGSPLVGLPTAMFCNPGRLMPPEAQAVHHIASHEVAEAPALADVAPRLAEDGPAFLVAHNAKFEQHFLPNAPAPWICTYKVALRLWPDAPSHSNQVLRYFLGLDLGDGTLAMPPHRAGPDAYVTAHLFARMIEDGACTVDDMARWSSGPPLLPRITFGKHRGSRWEDAPKDYLEWIVNKSDLDSDTKANARHHLKARG